MSKFVQFKALKGLYNGYGATATLMRRSMWMITDCKERERERETRPYFMNEWKVVHALHIFIKCLFLVMQFILYCCRACKKGALLVLLQVLIFFAFLRF